MSPRHYCHKKYACWCIYFLHPVVKCKEKNMSSSNYSFWSETLNSSVTQGSLNAEVFSLITVNAFSKRIILSLDRSAFEGININPPSVTSEICNLLCPATCGRCTKKCKPLLLGLTLLGIDQVESCGVSDYICDYKICRRDFSYLLALFTKVYRANRMKSLLVKIKITFLSLSSIKIIHKNI